MIFYFSATGNSRYAAERLAAATGETAVSVESADPHVSLAENEALGFVAPVHFWQLALPLRQFLQKLTVSCRHTPYTYIVTTYGTTPGCTFADAKKMLARRGIALTAGFSVKMPDNWTPMFDLSDPEKVKRQNDMAEEYIAAVLRAVSEKVTGNRMQRKAPYAVRLFSSPCFDAARKTKNFYAEETCVGCGRCAENCPMQAIELREGRPVWVKAECALCLRCLHLCPKFAIQYGDGKTKAHGQYQHPHKA